MILITADIRAQKKIERSEELETKKIIWDQPDNASFDPLIKAWVKAQLVETDVVVNARVNTQSSLECSRCLRSFKFPINSKFQHVVPLNQEKIDLTNEIRESILIELPIHPVCNESCKGICSECGINKNEKSCECITQKGDVRWEKLKELKVK